MSRDNLTEADVDLMNNVHSTLHNDNKGVSAPDSNPGPGAESTGSDGAAAVPKKKPKAKAKPKAPPKVLTPEEELKKKVRDEFLWMQDRADFNGL